jgi:hypothetical protein
MLFLLFSRAALLLLPFAMLFVYRYLGIKKKYLIISAIFFVSIFGLGNVKVIFDYLFFSKFVDGTGGEVLGSFYSRFDQWNEILSIFTSEFGVLIHGMGVGTYGLLLAGDLNAGSHNLFLDHMLASGVAGLFFLVLGFSASILYPLRRGYSDILFAVFALILLAFREFSFSYLYVTSMGGLVLVYIIYAIAKNQSGTKVC